MPVTDTRTDRQHLEDIARRSLDSLRPFTEPALRDTLAGNPEAAGLLQAVQTMESLLTEYRLIEIGGETMNHHPERIVSMATVRLEALADAAVKIVEQVSEPGVPAILAGAGQIDTLASLRHTENELIGFGYRMPESSEITMTLEEGQAIRQIERNRIDAVVASSLDTLEEFASYGFVVDGPASAGNLRSTKSALETALRDSDYLLPGDNLSRKEPLSHQAPRGTNEQVMEIVKAANNFAAAVTDEVIGQSRIEGLDENMQGLGRFAFAQRINALKRSLAETGFTQNMVAENEVKPIVIDDERTFEIGFVRRFGPIRDVETMPEHMARKEVMKIDEATLSDMLKVVSVSGHTEEEAVRNFGRYAMAMEDGRASLVVLTTGSPDFPLSRFDDIERKIAKDRAGQDIAEGMLLSEDNAKVLAGLLDVSIKITDTAGIDTQQPDHVAYPISLAKAFNSAFKAYKDNQTAALSDETQSSALDSVREIAGGIRRAPGMTAESAAFLEKALDEIAGIPEVAKLSEGDKGDRTMTMPMEYMDRVIGAVDPVLSSGAFIALASIAGLEGFDKDAFEQGRQAAAFSTLREAMSAGRSKQPGAMIKSIRKAAPEMSSAHYSLLTPEERKRCHAFVVRPGQPGLFKDFDTRIAMPGDPVVAENRQNHMRIFIKDALAGRFDGKNVKDEDGKLVSQPSKSMRAALLNMERRSIVAPNLDEAQVLRQMSERVLEEHKREIQARHQAWVDKEADKITADFNKPEVERFVRIVEASGAVDTATMVKRNGQLHVEHPEAPTLVANVNDIAILDKAREGYKIAKVSTSDLRNALASEPDKDTVRIRLHNDHIVTVEAAKTKPNLRKEAKPFSEQGGAELVA